MPMIDFTVEPQKSHTCTKSCDHGAPRLTLRLFTHSGCSPLKYEHIRNLLLLFIYFFFTVSGNRSNRCHFKCKKKKNKILNRVVCVRSHGAAGAVPERGELRQAHGLDVDVRLSVEPSAGVLQLNGVDLTQSHGVRQHCLVHCSVCLTAGHKHTHGHGVFLYGVLSPPKTCSQ